MADPASAHEAEPLPLLRELDILDTPPEPAFDALLQLALQASGCSAGALAFADTHRLWLKAAVGVEPGEQPRDGAGPLAGLLDDGATPAWPRHATAPVRLAGQRVATLAVFDADAGPLPAGTGAALEALALLAGELLAARRSGRARSKAGDDDDAARRAGTEQQARELEMAPQRWRIALEMTHQGVWDWDLHAGRMYVSPGWRALLGLDGDVGQAHCPNEWAGRIHPDDLVAARARLAAHLRGDTDSYSGEYRMRHADGRWRWMLNRGKVVLRGPDGRAWRIVGTLTDMTERRELEAARRDHQATELAARVKDQFLSRMSHEMRTPLNAVLGFAQLLQDRDAAADAARVQDYAEHMLRAGRHLLALVDDVLDLRSLENERLDLQAVALAPLVARAVDAVREAADARGLHLHDDVDPALCVRADAERLLQVVVNLSSNAVKFNRPAGHVRWRAEAQGADRIALFVEDSGAGINDLQQALLFQPFERLGRETGSVEGTGLGLIIAQSLTEKMGGTLRIDSRPGAGTCVTLELPAAERAAGDAPGALVLPPPPAGAPLRLLYVEDNRVNALLFAEAVRMLGAVELKVAEDGAEALETVAGWRPDLLVLDAHLPGMSGFQLLQRLRVLPGLERTPAVMCSADAMPDDLARARDAGFVDYWTKPIDLGRVMADLRRFAAATTR